MEAVAAGSVSRVLDARPAGVYVEHRERAERPAPAWRSGIPVFVGFSRSDDGMPRGRRAGISFTQWDAAAFDARVAPADRSFLAAAVRGLFANGGGPCVVLTVPWCGEAHERRNALLRVLQPGGLLDDRSDIDLVCLPDVPLATPDRGDDGEAWRELSAASLGHCERMGDRFAIVDSPHASGLEGQDPVAAMLHAAGSLRSAYGALYFPWLVTDPSRGASQPMAGNAASTTSQQWRCRMPSGPSGVSAVVPPCGHVAGVYARLDRTIGVQRAPANETVEGVLDTSLQLSDPQRGLLGEAGVNVLHTLRGRGVRVGGARTLSGHARWSHVSTARVILDFRRWLAHGLRDLVFEPQTAGLRDLIRIRLVSRCLDLQRRGALAGDASSQAFFVNCDAQTNPADVRAQGQVVAHVGLAPSVPAEFILIRVVHDASGFTVSGLS